MSGTNDGIWIGGNGANELLDDVVNLANGGTIYELNSSRVDFYGSGVTANIGTSEVLGAFGSSLTVNASGTNDGIWIGGNGANESLDDVVNLANGGTIYELNSSRVDFYGSGVTANIGTSEILGAFGSALTVNASGTSDGIWIGGNGQYSTTANADTVNLTSGGTIYEQDNSRVDFYGSGVTANIGASETLGAYGSALTINATGTNDQIYIGNNGEYATTANDIVVTVNNGAVYENGNSRADVTGASVTATLGANDLFGLYGSNDTITLGSADFVWLNPGATADKLIFSGNTGATKVTSFSNGDIIDLLSGTGGYATASAAFSALKSDGSGGSLLSLGTNGSIDIVGVAANSLSAANFKIG